MRTCALGMRMKTGCFALMGAWLLSISLGYSQEELEVNRDQLRPGQIRQVTIYPAKEPLPLLRHRLYPASDIGIDRNAALNYLRAIGIFRENVKDSNWLDFNTRVQHGNATDLAEIGAWLERQQAIIVEIARGHRSTAAKWGVLPHPTESQNWLVTRLPNIQESRNLARLLQLKANWELANHRLEDALGTISMGYKLGRDVGQAGTMVSDLVGLAEAGIMNEVMLELLQSAEAPSLYWALLQLPRPLIDIRQSIKSELRMIKRGAGLAMLKSPESRDWTAEQWREAYLQDMATIQKWTGDNSPAKQGYLETAVTAQAMAVYPVARKTLSKWGFSEEQIESMPALQAVAVYLSRGVKRVVEETSDAMSRPILQAIDRTAELEEKLAEASVDGPIMFNQGVLPLLRLLMPSYAQVLVANVRFENRLAALKVIEAIRLHVGTTGKFPERLSDISIVPVPKNEFTQRPFRYERTSSGATLYELTDSLETKTNWMVYDLRLGGAK